MTVSLQLLCLIGILSKLHFSQLDQCLLPYYGGCSYTEICESDEISENCNSCLPGYYRIPGNPFCTRKFLPNK